MPKLIRPATIAEQHELFVATYLAAGGHPDDGPAAAVAAGFAKPGRDAERTASILLGSSQIARRIKEAAVERIATAAGAAVATIVELCKSGPPQTRLAAAKEILDRSIGPIMSRSAVVTAIRPMEDIITELDAEDAEGARLVKIVEEAGLVIDAKFREACGAPVAAPPPANGAPPEDAD